MTRDTIPPPDDLEGKEYPGHSYKRPPAPAAPPPSRKYETHAKLPLVPKHKPVLPRRPPVKIVKDPPMTNFVGWLLLGTFVLLCALGYAKTMGDLDAWAKDYNYRHCTGVYDTFVCREDKAKENAKAYKEYKESS